MRKIFLTTLILLLFTGAIYSQEQYRLHIPGNNFDIYQNTQTKSFDIKDKSGNIRFHNIKAFHVFEGGIEAIDTNNNLLFIQPDSSFALKKSINEILRPIFGCGTVPHYTLSVKENDYYFQVWSDETFYDSDNLEPPVMIVQVPKSEADSVFFINGLQEFNYTSDFGINWYLNSLTTDPGNVIFKKNGLYGIWGKSKAIYDDIFFENYLLKVRKNGLYSYFEVNPEAKYTSIDHFIGVFARIELPGNKSGYVKYNGEEYVW